MKSHTIPAVLLTLILSASAVWAQSPSSSPSPTKERHIGRTIGTIAGAVGGALAGFAFSDDDATYAERKMAVNMLIGGAAGGVGGYFLGRAIDRAHPLAFSVDPLKKQEILERLAAADSKRLRPFLPAENQ